MHAFLTGSKGPSLKKPDKQESSKGKKLIPWVEKYRPKSVDDVAYQDEVVSVLKRAVKDNDLQNMLFYGPPGTGKTSTILAVCRDLFGTDIYRQRVLEMNASDERGIDVVRNKVKNFAQLTASSTRPDGKSCPPFKVVILDEADSMTNNAQAALRRLMEKQTKTTRFCLICNYVSRIIDPITSRCAKFRFKPLSIDVLEKQLHNISDAENIKCDDTAIAALIETSEGDMRKAITSLQSVARLKTEDSISAQDVYEIAGVIPEEIVENILKVCHSGSYEKLENTIQDIIADGHSAAQLLTQLHDLIIPHTDINDKQKSTICDRLATVDKRLMDGADEYLQVMDLCTVIMQQICH